MNMRLLPIIGVTGFLSIALAGSAVAGGGWPPAPGNYKTADLTASANLVGPSTIVCGPKGCYPQPSEFAYVNVDRGLHTFKPRGSTRLVQQNGTMLNLYLFSTSGPSVYGCWMIADSVSHVHDDGQMSCGSFMTVSGFDDNHATATSQGQISGASATLTSEYAGIDSSSSHQLVKGAPVDACFF